MVQMILPPVFEVVLTVVLLFLLSKKHNVRWILISYAIYYVSMFAFFGDYTGSGSFLINALAYVMCLTVFFIPYILYAVFSKYDSFFYTLIFPAGIVLTDFIGMFTILSPGMNIGYRFFYATPLIQCASLIGAAGLSFIIGWFLSSVVTMISRKCKTPYVIATVLSALVLAGALLFGVIRLHNTKEPDRFVHAAWTTGPELHSEGLEWETISYEENMASFLATSEEAAEKGAEILIYAEEAFGIDKAKLDDFLSASQARAKKTNMAILISFDLETEDGEDCENCVYFINRKGEIAGKYIKRMVIPIVEAGFIRGDGTFGNSSETFACGDVDMAYSICYDGNFEEYVRRMQDDADLYLYPSWDWAPIENNHTMIAGFRAVENGVTLMKPTCYGRSVMYDSCGRIIYETHTKDGFEKVYTFDAPLSDEVTFYEKYSLYEDIIFLVFAAMLFASGILAIRKKKTE